MASAAVPENLIIHFFWPYNSYFVYNFYKINSFQRESFAQPHIKEWAQRLFECVMKMSGPP